MNERLRTAMLHTGANAEELLVNTHIHGSVAACAPVLHLRKIAGSALVTSYLDSFDRIWDQATPWTGS